MSHGFRDAPHHKPRPHARSEQHAEPRRSGKVGNGIGCTQPAAPKGTHRERHQDHQQNARNNDEEVADEAQGAAADTDTMVASVKAYVTALNKLLTKREKKAPEAMSA